MEFNFKERHCKACGKKEITCWTFCTDHAILVNKIGCEEFQKLFPHVYKSDRL